MKNPSPALRAMLCLVLLAGCAPESETGSAQLAVSVPQALASPIARVTVTVSAADFPSFSTQLASSSGSWTGVLGNIPVGFNRSFLAQALDSSDKVLFQGSASPISITANQPSPVTITLQQASAPPVFQNEAPVIDSLSASPSTVSVGGVLTAMATAHDPNTGDTWTSSWSATAGAFSAPSALSTSWTAPATPGLQTLTLTLTDAKGLSASASATVNVTSAQLPP